MHLKFDNVNSAFISLVEGVHTGKIPTIKTETRNGGVLQIEEPVTITYNNPRKRVLLNNGRDQNCFFTLMEAIWMLSGSNLVKPLAYFTPNILNYSDDGVTLNGAYGYRWRHAFVDRGLQSTLEVDQLNLLIEHLRTTPNSRRAVLQMWNVEDDLLKIGPSEYPDGDAPSTYFGPQFSKDTACNLSVCFSITEHRGEIKTVGYHKQHPNDLDVAPCNRVLDMTVFNRSNDLIWGALGANYVHFSYLQEYIANCLGIQGGVYNQVSNNMHVYLNNWKPEEWLKDSEHSECYPELAKLPLVKDKEKFDKECKWLVSEIASVANNGERGTYTYTEPYIAKVVDPMLVAFMFHKARMYAHAKDFLTFVEAPDWRRAGTEWLERREANWKAKQEKVV